MSTLHDKVAVVTGASRGIGRAIAVDLASQGARLVLGCRKLTRAAETALAEVQAAGAPAAYLAEADLASPSAAGDLVEDAIERMGGLDILVNNAAIQRSSMAHKTTDADWLEVVAVNLNAVFFTSRAALRVMRANKAGHIINVASASSYVAQPGAASYVATKHAIVGLTKALALENARHGVLINAIAPGLTQTDMTEGLTEQQREGLMRLVPLGRMAQPQEHASLVRWLVTEARYSTGNVFHASGGVTMG